MDFSTFSMPRFHWHRRKVSQHLYQLQEDLAHDHRFRSSTMTIEPQEERSPTSSEPKTTPRLSITSICLTQTGTYRRISSKANWFELDPLNSYAIVRKEPPPRPPAPIRRRKSTHSLEEHRQFSTLPNFHSVSPARPTRNYSTINPNRPPRGRSVISLNENQA